MKAIINKDGKVLATCRQLKVNYTQLKRLIEDLNIGKISLVHPELDIVFKIDLDEFMDFREYYKDFIFDIEVTNRVRRDNFPLNGYSLNINGAKDLYKR